MLGVVLAGGQSRRMGQDKAMLRHADGQTWLARNIALLEHLCDEVWVSGRDGARGIIDPHPFQGPAAAIMHCFQILAADEILFIPVDLPLLNLATLQQLRHQNADAIHFAQHPLPLLLRNTPNVKRRMQNMHAPFDISVHQLLAGLDVFELALDAPTQMALTNANRPQDWDITHE